VRKDRSPRAGSCFEVKPVLDKLAADEVSETTLVAFLPSENGEPLRRERVRFRLLEGTGTLSAPALGSDGTPQRAAGIRGTLPQEPTPGVEQRSAVAVDGISIGGGMYVARYRSGVVPGVVTIGATWLSSPQSPLPAATTEIELVTAAQLTVRASDRPTGAMRPPSSLMCSIT
jgi:adhesin/invasin